MGSNLAVQIASHATATSTANATRSAMNATRLTNAAAQSRNRSINMGEINVAADPKPLTVAEIIAFDVPPSLRGWKYTQDINGGSSFRATIGDIDYIATPHSWAGRTLQNGGFPMGNVKPTGMNIQEVLEHSMGDSGTIETNSREFNPGELLNTGTSESCPVPDPTPYHYTQHPAFIPGIIAGTILLTFIGTSILATLAYFLFGRRSHGNP